MCHLGAWDCSFCTEVCHVLALESHINLREAHNPPPVPWILLLLDPDMVKNKTGCLRNSYQDHIRQALYQNSSCAFTSGFPAPEKWHLIKTFEKQPLTDNSSGCFYWSYEYPVFLNTERLLTLPVFWWKLIPSLFSTAWKCIFFYQVLICHLSAPLNIFVVALQQTGKTTPKQLL